MTRHLFAVSALVLIGLALGCAQPAGPDHEAMIAAAKALDQRFVEAFNSADVDGVTATYWNNAEATYFSPGALMEKGPAAIRADWEAAFQSLPGGKIEMIGSQYMAAGDVVIGWGQWRVTIPSDSGEPTVLTGRYTDVKAERDGKWVYLLDHASVPMAPPPAEAAPEAQAEPGS